jgi:hypothetical protein
MRRLDEAERTLADLDPTPFPPASRAAHQWLRASRCGASTRRRPAPRSFAPLRDFWVLMSSPDAVGLANHGLTVPLQVERSGCRKKGRALSVILALFRSRRRSEPCAAAGSLATWRQAAGHT